MTKLLAYHGDQKIKDKYKNRLDQHIKMDELVKGFYFKKGKGCFVGCTLHGENHLDFEEELGIPEEIAHISDFIFESLSDEDSTQFSKDWHDQIKVGADLTMVWPKLAHAILTDEEHGVLIHVQEDEFKQQKEAIENVVELYKEWISTGVNPNRGKWDGVKNTAREASNLFSRRKVMNATLIACYGAYWDCTYDMASILNHHQYPWLKTQLFKLLKEAK